jgi:hypothetical protein
MRDCMQLPCVNKSFWDGWTDATELVTRTSTGADYVIDPRTDFES